MHQKRIFLHNGGPWAKQLSPGRVALVTADTLAQISSYSSKGYSFKKHKQMLQEGDSLGGFSPSFLVLPFWFWSSLSQEPAVFCSMSAATAGKLPDIDQPGASRDFVVITLLMNKALSQIMSSGPTSCSARATWNRLPGTMSRWLWRYSFIFLLPGKELEKKNNPEVYQG